MSASTTPSSCHTKAADAHEMAAKTHRAAADMHTKGDHKAGHAQAEKAVKDSTEAHACCTDAMAKSKTAAH